MARARRTLPSLDIIDDPAQFIDDLCDERMDFLQGLGTWPVFGPGWTNRVTDLRAYCKNLLVSEFTWVGTDELVGS